MFAYLAFKALTGHYPDALQSAQQKTPWKFNSTLGLPCLKVAKRTFKAGHGVYVATVDEARGMPNTTKARFISSRRCRGSKPSWVKRVGAPKRLYALYS